MAELHPRLIGRDNVITLGTTCVVLLVLFNVAWQLHAWKLEDALWKASSERDMREIRRLVDELNARLTDRTANAWRHRDMADFAARLQARNPELDVPVPERCDK